MKQRAFYDWLILAVWWIGKHRDRLKL